MPTDFAFLFYPGDYLRDTQCLSEPVQVAYDRIMCEHMRNISTDMTNIAVSQKMYLFFTKRLTDHQREELELVLEKKPDGFQIPWVAQSICKRKSYSDSRRENRTKRHDKHILTHDVVMENEIEIDNTITVLNKINVEFEKFWDLYAKKVGDQEKIKKKWESLKEPERTLIMEKLPAYISATPDKQFRKNPYSYLNQKSWNDEIIKPAQNGTYNGSASKNNKSASTHALAARLAGLDPGKS